jgi:phospholysine phosphohistidine inorganic pyrophosphate phosphatase
MPIRGLLLDFDGVIATGGTLLPGALDALRRFAEAGLPYRVLTNSTLHTRQAMADWLSAQGVAAGPEMWLTPAAAAVRWLHEQGQPKLYLVTHPRIHTEFRDFELVEGDSGADFVVISDMDDELTMGRLNGALRQIVNGAKLLSLGLGRYWKAADGLRLDTGAFTKGLEFATGTQAIVMGKPTSYTFHSGAEALDLPPAEVAMVGDDILSDVGAAQEAGLIGILVRSGKFRPQDLQRGVVPDAVIEDLAALPALLELPA